MLHLLTFKMSKIFLNCVPTAASSFKTFSKVTSFISQTSNFSTLAGSSRLPHINKQANSTVIIPSRGQKTVWKTSIEKYRVLNYDRENGKRTSCEAVPERFFRLRWGAWIRTISSRDSLHHRKSGNDWRISRQHVFCNAKQSRLLDKLAGSWYIKPHYYVDDPYEPYHKREEFLYTRTKPVPRS